jgi:hypothetical protein
MTEPRTDLDRHEDDIKELRSSVDHLTTELAKVSGKIPDDLAKRLITIELQLGTLIKDTESEFVSKTDFEILKVEHNQIKRLVWGFIVMVLTSVIGGLLALVVHNATILAR